MTGARQKRDGRNMCQPNAPRELIEAWVEPDVFVSGIAFAYALNTTILREWLIGERTRTEPSR